MFVKAFVFLVAIVMVTLAEYGSNIEQPLEEYNGSVELNDYNDDCLRGCPRILDPICAVDENHPEDYKYFHNQCLMEYDNCRESRAWKPTQMLLCIKYVDPVVRDDCMRACPLIYNPVCASDGKSYEIFGNQCSFGMENCLASGKWLEVHGEKCGL